MSFQPDCGTLNPQPQSSLDKQPHGLHRRVALPREDLRQEPVAICKRAGSNGCTVHAPADSDMHVRGTCVRLHLHLGKAEIQIKKIESKIPGLQLRAVVRRIHAAGHTKQQLPTTNPRMRLKAAGASKNTVFSGVEKRGGKGHDASEAVQGFRLWV